MTSISVSASVLSMKTLRVLTCTRCGHTWTPFVRKPVRCPKCRSTYWNKPYVRMTKVVRKRLGLK